MVDRNNTLDIVISRGDITRFCSFKFARAIERVAMLEGLGQWTTPGGLRNTAIWASIGIQSVNFSACYNNGRTDIEKLDMVENYGTYEFK